MARGDDNGREPASVPGGDERVDVSALRRRREESGQELLTSLGVHLRAARLERKLTLTQVASAAGLTKGFLSQLERGESSASISSLLALCSVLDISIAKLLEHATAATEASPVVRREERRVLYLGGDGVVDELMSPPRERRFEVFETHIEPLGSPGNQPYALDAEFGFAYVAQGRLDFVTNGTTHTLRRGDTITYSPRDPHTFRNPSRTREAVVVFLKSPAVF